LRAVLPGVAIPVEGSKFLAADANTGAGPNKKAEWTSEIEPEPNGVRNRNAAVCNGPGMQVDGLIRKLENLRRL
jgi:hypothetical protein